MIYISHILRRILTIIVIIAALGAIAGIVIMFPKKPLVQEPGEKFADLGNDHIPNLTTPHKPYNSLPPTSSPHPPRIAMWGSALVQIPDELQVHNLEDGGALIHYDPARVDAATIEKIQKIVSEFPQYVIAEPYIKPALPSPIVLTAWTRMEKLETFDEKKIRAFIAAYKGIDHHVYEKK